MNLDDEDQVLLLDVISNAIEGFQDAKDKMIEDSTLTDLDTFNEVLQENQNKIDRLERMHREVLDVHTRACSA